MLLENRIDDDDKVSRDRKRKKRKKSNIEKQIRERE
jgi:hypothetical protein